MTMLNTSSSWNVGRVAARCAGCGVDLPANTACWAALCDGGKISVHEAVTTDAPAKGNSKKQEKAEKEAAAVSPFVRVDYCEACWAAGKRPEQLTLAAAGESAEGADAIPGKLTMFSFWKTVVPVPQQKKKLLVDDSVLVDVFQRMEGKNEPQEIRFRFVLALILMRKRLLKYEGMEEAPKSENRNLNEETAHPAPPPHPTPPPELWRMIPRGGEQAVIVINPHLTAEQITEVSQQLSAILAEEI